MAVALLFEGWSNKRLARLAGLLYLFLAITGGFSELYVRTTARAVHDPVIIAETIRESATIFALGIVSDLLSVVCFLLLAFALYVLLSPVSRAIAASFVVFVAIAVAILGVNTVNQAAALALATDPAYAEALGTTSANALAMLFLDMHRQGYLGAQVFFGLWLLPLGYLVWKSGYFPKVLGILLMIGCFGYLGDLIATAFSSGRESSLSMYLGLPAGLAEIVFLLWLLVMGAKEVPKQSAAPA